MGMGKCRLRPLSALNLSLRRKWHFPKTERKQRRMHPRRRRFRRTSLTDAALPVAARTYGCGPTGAGRCAVYATRTLRCWCWLTKERGYDNMAVSALPVLSGGIPWRGPETAPFRLPAQEGRQPSPLPQLRPYGFQPSLRGGRQAPAGQLCDVELAPLCARPRACERLSCCGSSLRARCVLSCCGHSVAARGWVSPTLTPLRNPLISAYNRLFLGCRPP